MADLLLNINEEPFQPVQSNIDYWKSLVTGIINLFTKLYQGSASPHRELIDHLSITYACSELSLEAIRIKVNPHTAHMQWLLEPEVCRLIRYLLKIRLRFSHIH